MKFFGRDGMRIMENGWIYVYIYMYVYIVQEVSGSIPGQGGHKNIYGRVIG